MTFRRSSCAGVSNENPKMRIYVTTLLLQIRQISETAGAACHEEVFQMSGSMDELDNRRMLLRWWSGAGRLRVGPTSFWRRAVRNSR